MAMAPQVFVAPWSAISANDIDLCSRATRGFHQFIKKIEKTRVVVVHFSRAMITQKVIELIEGRRDIGIAVSVHDIQLFAGVCGNSRRRYSRLHGVDELLNSEGAATTGAINKITMKMKARVIVLEFNIATAFAEFGVLTFLHL